MSFPEFSSSLSNLELPSPRLGVRVHIYTRTRLYGADPGCQLLLTFFVEGQWAGRRLGWGPASSAERKKLPARLAPELENL